MKGIGNKTKYLVIPAVVVVGLLAGSTVSAHGFGGFFMAKGTPQEISVQWEQRLTQDASLLGISLEEMKTYWSQGKNLHEVATEKGLTKEQLQEKMKVAREAEHKAFLSALVSQGKLTQAQADARFSAMQQKQKNIKSMMKMKGGMHHQMIQREVKSQ